MNDGAPHPPPPTLADDRRLLATATRQSPVAIVFIAWRFVRNLGWGSLAVAFVVLFSGQAPLGGLIAVFVFGVVGLIFTTLAWWRFVFTIDAGELVVSKGVISQERLTIPLDRIQSVSVNQRLLHRPIGVVAISVDTAGSSEAELEIDAVDRTRAEALQRLVAGASRAAGPGAPAPAADQRMADPEAGQVVTGAGLPGLAGSPAGGGPEQSLVARTPIELLKVGLARWPWAGLAALAPLLALTNEFADRLPVDELDVEGRVEETLPEEVGVALVAAAIGLVLAVIVFGAVFGVILQVVRTLVTDWDLKLTRTTAGLRRTAGLFSTTSRASTLSRIQGVQTDQTPFQRFFGIRRLTLPTIGQGDLVVDGVTAAELGPIRRLVLGPAPGPELDREISPLYIFLATRNLALGLVVPIVALAFAIGWWALLLVLLVPLRWLVARRQWRLRRWGLSADRIAERYELIDLHTAEIELIKAQSVAVTQSFFERRRDLATVRITTAEGYLAVPLIPVSEARAVRDLALFRVESDRRAWM